jgi:hypothetical protein
VKVAAPIATKIPRASGSGMKVKGAVITRAGSGYSSQLGQGGTWIAAYGLSPLRSAVVATQVGSQSLMTSGRWLAYNAITNSPATSPAASDTFTLHALEGGTGSPLTLGSTLMARRSCDDLASAATCTGIDGALSCS